MIPLVRLSYRRYGSEGSAYFDGLHDAMATARQMDELCTGQPVSVTDDDGRIWGRGDATDPGTMDHYWRTHETY